MRRPQSAREYPSGPITSEVEYVICLTSIICRMIAWYGNCKQGFFAHKRRFTLFQQVKSVDDINVPLFVSRVVRFQPMNTRLIIHFLSRIVIWLSRFEAWNVMMSLRFDNKKQKNLKTTYVLWGIDDIFRLIAKKNTYSPSTHTPVLCPEIDMLPPRSHDMELIYGEYEFYMGSAYLLLCILPYYLSLCLFQMVDLRSNLL